ncbi:MAG: prolipoprotein diacylglyceryl transferase family protein [Coriobacteriia bacterium]|nr:prolipoprotein diacylglyceryl transferase family protein [Coriobacteriia bacterium]
MKPVLLQLTLGGNTFSLLAYSTFYTLAWITAPLVGAYIAHRRGLPGRRVLAIYGIALLSGIVGARVFDLFIAGNFYAEDPGRIWGLTFQGFSLYGGLSIAALTGIALTHLWKLPIWRVADSAIPALVVGQVLMRTGCFLRGCCFGLPTDLPWGVTFPMGSPAWTQQLLDGTTGIFGLMGEVRPVHPTQLYEMAGALLFGALAVWLMQRTPVDRFAAPPKRPRTLPDGVPFLVYALGFTLVRLGNQFLRERQAVITAPEWFYPVFYVALALVLGALIVWRVRETRQRP